MPSSSSAPTSPSRARGEIMVFAKQRSHAAEADAGVDEPGIAEAAGQLVQLFGGLRGAQRRRRSAADEHRARVADLGRHTS